MKKKLEAELISIAHRILKLKNRADIDQLQQETLKLYEKLSVIKFVEDHFGGNEPTIGRASAVFSLEEIYDLKEEPVVHGNEVEAQEEKARAEKKAATQTPKGGDEDKAEPEQEKEDKENESGEGLDTDGDGKMPVADEEAPSPKGEQPEAEANDKGEEAEAPKVEENVVEDAPEEAETTVEEGEPEAIEEAKTALEEEEEEDEDESLWEPTLKIQVEKPAEDIKAEEVAAAAVFEKEAASTPEEEERAADAEIKTIEPNANAPVEPAKAGFEFAFDRTEEPKKQKEISFEDFHDYKEPEFVKKDGDARKAEASAETNDWRSWEPAKPAAPEQPKAEEPKTEAPAPEAPKPAETVRDWREWEPAKSPLTPEGGKEEKEAPKPVEVPKPLNTGLGRSITLGLNDRIAFEKNLFGGSADDLNRVISQLNTLNNFDEARNFIDDLVKPDYANWAGKEEYEERFMALVEKRFS